MTPKMRILHEGVKNFTQRHVSLNIMILKYDNCDECFEVIAYDIISMQEIPRVYINIWALNALISKRKILNGPKTITSLSDIKIDESEQVELLLNRLTVKNTAAIRVVELTFEAFDHDRVCVKGKLVYLDMVQVKPPDLETYVLPNSQALRVKTYDQIQKEKEQIKKKEHDKNLINNVIKIFNTERHVELRAPKAMTEDNRALLQMRQIQFDLDFQLKPFDRELARARWMKAISRILYSILYVKILNRLDVYQWFQKPKNAGELDMRNAKNLKYRARASFTDDDLMYGHRKKDDPSEYMLSHRDDSHILESFNPIPHAKPFKAFNYGPFTSPATNALLTKSSGLSSLPMISLPHIGDVVRTLAPVLDHSEEDEKLAGVKPHPASYHSYHHQEVVTPYHHEDHDYFPCNKFHPHHLNHYETTGTHLHPSEPVTPVRHDAHHDHNESKEDRKHQESKEEHQTEGKHEDEEGEEEAGPMSPRSARFRLLPTLKEAPAGMLPSLTVSLPSSSSVGSSGSSSSHTTPSYASSRLHAAVGDGLLHKTPDHHSAHGHHHNDESRRHSVSGTKLMPVGHESSVTSPHSHHASGGHSSDRRHSVDSHHHTPDVKKLAPLSATHGHHSAVASPTGISHSHSGHSATTPTASSHASSSGNHDAHTELPSISNSSGKHNNHIHGLKLVKKVGSFKLSASEKHDLLVASVGTGGTVHQSTSDKPISPTRSNHLRVLKDLKNSHENNPETD